ncbi:hypothetical protein OSTOST_19814, partial [Ostertagia ostertagi]
MQELWENGRTCECDAHPDSFCSNGICETNMVMKPETKTSTKKPRPPVEGPDSCKANTGMTDDLREIFLKKHNYYRLAVVVPDVYDCEIEANALRHAEKCRWGHSIKADRFGLGENVWASLQPEMNRSLAAEMPDDTRTERTEKKPADTRKERSKGKRDKSQKEKTKENPVDDRKEKTEKKSVCPKIKSRGERHRAQEKTKECSELSEQKGPGSVDETQRSLRYETKEVRKNLMMLSRKKKKGNPAMLAREEAEGNQAQEPFASRIAPHLNSLPYNFFACFVCV